MVAPHGLEVLAFDVFGTVVDWRSSIIAEGERFGSEKGLRIDWAAFADAWHEEYRPSLDRVRNGELPWTKLDDLNRAALERILPRFHIAFDDDSKRRLNGVWHRLKPWPDALPGLERLKRRFLLATLSNGNLSLLARMAKHAGLPWHCILSAENVRRYKPDPETYQLIPSLFDLRAEQVMLVAAHEYDLRAARRHGLKTAYVHRPLEHGPGRATEPPPSDRYDVVVGDFIELADHLGA
ncbi:MAG TPA: haloacid dehalogenase type II [Candidatus Eisenbacteria bacterium]|nr:haloacid dehalogenase type II [Candidatus Eisenbacteria bacterium]